MQDARRAKKLLAVSKQLNALADRLETDGLQESNQQRRSRIAYDYAVEAGRCLVEARDLGAFGREGSFVAKDRTFEPGRPSKQRETTTDVASLFQLALRDDRDEKANFNDVFCSLWRHWLPTNDDKFEYRRFQRPRLDLTSANYIRAFAEFIADLAPAKTPDGDDEIPQTVTLDKMAAAVSRSKKTLERLKTKGKLPRPDVEGGGGKPDEWNWSNVKPILEEHYNRKLPERFPSLRK